MRRLTTETRSRLFAASAGLAFLAAGAGTVQAAQVQAEPSDARNLQAQSLQDQVRALTALVKSVSERDQQQIQALSEQVKALQAQQGRAAQPASTAERSPATAGLAPETAASQAVASTRTEQNARGGFSLPEARTAQVDAAVALPRVVQNATHRFAMQSPDGQYSIGFTGDIQFDTGDYFSYRPASRVVGPQDLSSGVNARRARIGVTGTAFGDWGFALVYDAGNSQDTTAKGIETAQVVYSGLKGAAFEIGYSNTFYTLDQSTSSNDTLFLERATPSNVATNFNTGDARSNAGVRFFGDRYWVGGYLTGPGSGDSHTLTGERFGAFERAAVQVLNDKDYTLHLGVGVDQLLRAPNTGNGTADVLTLNDQPELRIDPTALLSTGVIGTTAHPVTGGYVVDVETAANYKNFFWQGEYYHYNVARSGLSGADFDGMYGQISWTLTGESHKYNPQAASYYRIYPKHPFSLKTGDWGAWELAGRFSYINLNNEFVTGQALSSNLASIDGGLQRSYTVGLNWYPNDLVRFLLDYNRLDYDKTNGTAVAGAALGVPIGAKFDAISLRAQVAY